MQFVEKGGNTFDANIWGEIQRLEVPFLKLEDCLGVRLGKTAEEGREGRQNERRSTD